MLDIKTTPIENLREHLVYKRQPPIFDSQISQFQSSLNGNRETDPNEIMPLYLKTFDSWLHNSKLNRLDGLSALPYRDFCVGVTGYLDDLYVRYGDKIRYYARDYSYHWRLGVGKKVEHYSELKKDDQFILSTPFCYFGDKHPYIDDILDHCDSEQVHVHIDSAWYGCVKDFVFDYQRPCIKSAGFSLSKGLSSGHNRMGVRYAKSREVGPITIVNDFNMAVTHLMWLGVQLMNEYSCDYLQNKYGVAYMQLCKKLNLRATNAIHTAFGYLPNNNEEEVPVGVSSILKKMI